MKKAMIAAAFALAACAPTVTNGLVGSQFDVLVKQVGPPAAVYPMGDGKKSVTYSYKRYDGGIITPMNVSSCDVYLLVNRAGEIEMTRWEGNVCRPLLEQMGML